MNPSRAFAPLLFAALLLLPLAASAQSGLPLLDPQWQLVPRAHLIDPTCPVGAPLGFGGVLVGIQNLMNAAISFGILVVVFVLVIGGIMLVLSPVSAENRSKAKKIITNALVGILIVMSSWVVVDFVMKLLYDADNAALGPWNSILVGGDACVKVDEDLKPLFSGILSGAIPGQGTGGGGTWSGPLPTGPGPCNAATVQQAAAQSAIAMPMSEAAMLACFAGPESRCGTQMQNYNWNRGSTAYGPFQILLSTHSAKFENPTCWRAAGVTSNLNCSSGFRNGNPIPGSPVVERCKKAAASLACSTVVAHQIFITQGPSAWSGNRDSTAAHQQCQRGG